MNFSKLAIFILIVFLKTGNDLSANNIFNVNNIEIAKKDVISNEKLANQAIQKGFIKLVNRIILYKDAQKILNLKFSEIRDLVLYYQVYDKKNEENKKETLIYNVFFDKDKLHKLFYQKNISYSEILNKDLYLLPIFKKNNQLFVYNQNFFYENWNEIIKNDLLEFILPLENIEVIRNLNLNKENLLSFNLNSIFQEYSGKNLAMIIIEDTNSTAEKIYLRTEILGKKIDKSFSIKRLDLNEKNFYEKIIKSVSDEIINIVKTQNLIDIKTPSFLNAKLKINKNSNLQEFNTRIKNIDLIDETYVQELNNNYILIKIKFLGNINRIIDQLESQKILLKLINDEWSLKII